MSYKICNHFYIFRLALIFFFIISALSVSAQEKSYSKPSVTKKWKKYKRQVQQSPMKKMVELKSAIPGIIYDLRYASENNFMHRFMYASNTKKTYLREQATFALQKVQIELNENGLGLKIFDAYRPFSVTVKFWELVHDERYVANPSKGSGHNRGIAVDLTIVNLKTGSELNMGTGFDNFSDTAHHTFTALSEEILQNRNLLKTVMENNGFKAFDTEWWHYFLSDGSKYEILDMPFKKLGKKL